MDENYLLKTQNAKRLYFETAATLPIIDFHNHISVADLADDKSFENIYELWLKPDPYKHRLMRICGIPEHFITGDAEPVGKEDGRSGNFNQWVIDSLVEGDVVVVDMYDKIYKGTFLGGNLTTAIKTRTKTGGGIVWGGIRDVEQMKQVPDVQVYYRGIDPTPIREFVMKDFNSITRIGKATVLPGDIVYGAGGGVLFIPSHLVQEVVEGAAKTHVKDDFGFEMITQNKFTTAQIDRATWTKEMLDMLVEWINTDPRGEKYRDLDWSEEYYLAENGDPNDTQTML